MNMRHDYEDEELYIEDDYEEERVKVSLFPNRTRTIVRALIFSVIPILLFYMMESFEHNAFEEVRPLAQVYNIFLFELIAWILFFITGSGRCALRIETVIAFVYGLVNHYVMAFRSTPLVPWDIYSIKTAASVAENYDFTPSSEMISVCIGFGVLFLALHFVRLEFSYGAFLRVIPVLCISIVLGLFVNLLWDEEFQTDSYLYPFLFTPAHMTKVNGMAVTFSMNLAYVYVEKPDGYSAQRAQEILKQYEYVIGDVVPAEEMPNVIVIMNEAFSDLAVLGEFTTNEDYMPYIHSLQQGQENTITGNLTVSVCGGNTANSEFEFLTGHTMDYFPVGSIPYQQYIKSELPSLASQLQELGYATYGMHPYNASGWQRDEVYPLLGFETSFFLGDFGNRYYIRDYISDQTAYDKIIETYENKEEGTPMFVFEVTMQNHGGYSEEHENFSHDIQIQEFENDTIDQYLSLVKVSDQELKQLITYFEMQDEKTIIVFFGDHQPNDAVANPILRYNGVNTAEMTVEQASLRYQVPYVIWANYDIKEETNADTDISFLGANIMEVADMPTTPYQNFLLELEHVMDAGSDKEKADMLEQYQVLQYYFMFDYEKE